MEKLPKQETMRLRKKHVGGAVQTFFPDDPLKIVRASGQYMYDENGIQYLDCINNVCHVGHCHPHVVKAASEQMATLNTNSRFLHDNLVLLADRLTSRLPKPLSIMYLTNSGSEATDLALHLARYHTKAPTIITMDRAYHGHVESALSVSPYKFPNPKDFEQFNNTVVFSCPDTYRGKYNKDSSQRYIEDAQRTIEKCQARGKPIAGYIAESMQSCGGQIAYPDGYLKDIYKLVRAAGGVCIADEVQVGFGRMGSHYWAFETQGVVPDIVTIGKPMGNGHPVSAVITTQEIADSHAAMGIQYFNTFGGNPVSCAIALAVMDVIDNEKLMDNASLVGAYLTRRFQAMMDDIQLVGDVRGQGMFLGLDLVKNRQSKEPASEEAEFVVARMKQEHILISRDGPHNNVIKFKPPICFTLANAEFLADKLHDVLVEAQDMMAKHTVEVRSLEKGEPKRSISPYMFARLQALNKHVCGERVNGKRAVEEIMPDVVCLPKKVRVS